MEGIGLENMMGAEEVERLFADPTNNSSSEGEDSNNGNDNPDDNNEDNSNSDTTEVDFSDLLGDGNQPESVGSGENKGGNGGAPAANNDSGTPQTNLFSSITRILRDKGVFPDLSDDAVAAIQDEEALEKLFNDKVSGMFDERQQRLEKALNNGASSEEVKDYQQAMSYYDFLNSREALETLVKDGDDGEKLRKNIMYQDYVNRGFKHEKAVKLIEQSFADGSDIEDAKEALNSCKDFYKEKIDGFQQELENREKEAKAAEEKQYSSLKKNILDTESFYGGVKVDKATRQKAYDALTKPVFKDAEGNYLTALQKYQREKPIEFMQNFALMYALTDEFKNVDKLTKSKINAGIKKSFSELESIINSSRRNSDGSLNLANAAPDELEREKWTLA